MAHKFIIRTEKGRHDSLRESVKIFFTMTLIDSGRLTAPCYPRQRWWKQFDGGVDKTEEVSWGSECVFFTLGFCRLWPDLLAALLSVGIGSQEMTRRKSKAGETITITSPASGGIAWATRMTESPTKQSAVVVVNETGSAQDVSLAVLSPDGEFTQSIALFDPVQIGKTLTISPDLVLQVYAVDPSRELDKIHVPGPEDLTRPLFPVPLSCNELPASSSWRLVQDINGEIKLIKNDEMELGKHTIDALAKSIHDMHGRLSLVFKTLDDTQQRLANFEQLLSGNREQPLTTREDPATARTELPMLSREIPRNEPKLAGPELAFARMDSRVTLVEKSIAAAHEGIAFGQRGLGDVCAQLLGIERASVGTKGVLSAIQESCITTQHQVSALDRKIPVIEEKISGLGIAFGGSEKRVSAIGASLIAQKNRLSDLADRQIPQLEAKSKQMESPCSLDKLSMMQKSVDLAHDHLSTLDRRMLSIETRGEPIAARSSYRQTHVDSPLAGDSAPVFQGGTGRSGRQAPAMDAKADEIERSLTETKKDVSVIRKLLRTRLPTLESKADTLEKSIGQAQGELSVVQLSLASSGGRLAGLDIRMTAVEGSLRGVGTDPRHPGPITASCSHSPLLFPSQRRKSRSSTPSPSREAAFLDREDSDSDVGE